MITVPLDSRAIPELQPLTELRALGRSAPRLPFTARNAAEASRWQAACRATLTGAAGFLDDPPAPDPGPALIEEVDRGDFVRRKLLLRTAPHACMPFYLLVPKGAACPLPAVLAYHGHGYGVKDIVGLWEDGTERYEAEGYHNDFAVALCRRGFLVAAPEIACFGERQADYSHLSASLSQPVPTTCHNAATYAMMLGKSVLGMRLRDALRLVDYLVAAGLVDPARIGAMGISGGGMHAFFHAALDPRVRAAVVSGYLTSFHESILAVNHCSCNFVPGLLNIADLPDLSGLILPRPLLVEAGTRDEIFPVAAARAAVARAREICAVLGGDPQHDVVLDEFEGRHRISGRLAYDFLWDRLAGG